MMMMIMIMEFERMGNKKWIEKWGKVNWKKVLKMMELEGMIGLG